MKETAMPAKTVKTATVASLCCILCNSSRMGSLAKGFLPKVCRNSAEVCGNLKKKKKKRKNVWLRQERVQKFCGKLRKYRGNLRNLFCNDPFPDDPRSELLICRTSKRRARCSPEPPKQSIFVKTVMEATPLKLNPPFPTSWIAYEEPQSRVKVLGAVLPHLPVGKKFLRFCLVWPG